MTSDIPMTASDLYQRIVDTFIADPGMEAALLADVEATVMTRFGIALPKPASLAKTSDGFVLTYDGHDYDLGDPRTAKKGELNDAELELVSGGNNADCPTDKPPSDAPMYSDPTPARSRARTG